MASLGRVVAVSCVLGCGPRVVLPGDDETGGTSSGIPGTSGPTAPPPSTGPSTGPTPVTTGITTEEPPEPITVTTGVSFDVGTVGTTGECPPWTFEGCAELPRANVFVIGATPIGDFETDYAVFAGDALCDGCVETPNVHRIIFVNDPLEIPEWEPEEGLVLDLFAYEGPSGVEFEGVLTGYLDTAIASTSASVLLESIPSASDLAEPFDASNAVTIVGAFEALEDGWSLYGNFTAAYCPRLNNYAICE